MQQGAIHGYKCYGWATSASATRRNYAGGATYSIYSNGTTTTLYAVWGKSTFNVGDYVAYSPSGGSSSYSTTQGSERSGYGDQTISRDGTLTWRVMSISGNILTLIATTQSSSILYLRGADGYNNGVKLLNDACNELYKNTTLGATARSVKVEDINSLMGVTPSTALDSNYGAICIPSSVSTYSPDIFRYERWGSINGSYTGSLEQSDQNSWYSGGDAGTSPRGKYTNYGYTLSDYKGASTVELALVTCQSGSTGTASHRDYWLASRSLGWSIEGSCLGYNIFNVASGRLSSNSLSTSGKGNVVAAKRIATYGHHRPRFCYRG